jgi:hypothetical protein
MPRSLAAAGVLVVLVASTAGQTPRFEVERLGDPRHGDKDRMHLRDLLDVGLVDPTFCDRLAAPLAARQRMLIHNAE